MPPFPNAVRLKAASLSTSIFTTFGAPSVPICPRSGCRRTSLRRLGHVVTGVQKHYDKWTYVDEKREALESWARKLQSLIVPGSNWCPSAELDNLVFRCG